MHAFNIFRVRPILHSFNFLRIHPYTILTNKMTHILNFRDAKITFRLFEDNFVLGEEMENLIDMGELGFPRFTVDDNIIK
jgi:hypothetical protein